MPHVEDRKIVIENFGSFKITKNAANLDYTGTAMVFQARRPLSFCHYAKSYRLTQHAG